MEAVRRHWRRHTILRSRLDDRAIRVNVSSLTESERSVAHALMSLQEESTFALSHLVKSNGSKTSQAVKAIIRHANHNTIESKKHAARSPRAKRCNEKKAGLDTALTLVKLSGQSRAESKAGLALLCLRRDSNHTVVHKRPGGNWLAQLALRKKRSDEQWLALEKFRHQFPAVLRTSIRKV